MKAGNVLVGIAKLELIQNVMPHAPGRAGRKCRDGTIGKVTAQTAQLPVLGTKLMSPFGDAMRFVDGEETQGNIFEPRQRAFSCQALGR